MIAQRIRLYPNKPQAAYLDKRIRFAAIAHNEMLAKHKKMYDAWKADSSKEKPTARKVRDWLKSHKVVGYEDCTNMIVETEADNLDKASKNFFAKRAQYPTFHKVERQKSFSINKKNVNTCRIDGERRMHLSKDACIKMAEKPKFDNPKRFTFSKENGRYFVSIVFDDGPKEAFAPTGRPCGIDLGLKQTVNLADSEGNLGKISMDYGWLKAAWRKADRLRGNLSKKAKGSKRRDRANAKLQSQLFRIRNKMEDFANKTVHSLVKDYDVIGTEDLNLKGMRKNRRLSHSLQTKSLGTLVSKLAAKANQQGKRVVKVGRFFPSSQLCSNCGELHKEMKDIKKRVMSCGCGFSLDRDLNAAINILNESIRIVSMQGKE